MVRKGTIGIEWINSYHGRATNLRHTGQQARGFYSTLDALRGYELFEDDAWDTDFEHSGTGRPPAGEATLYVETVDMVYFSGHGHWSGAFFGVADHDNGQAGYREIILGKRLDWVVFDACDVLKHEPYGAAGDAIWRWGPSFGGIRAMLGFDNECSDEPHRGYYLALEMNEGRPVLGAWRRACQESENDSSTYYAFIYAVAPTGSTYGDQWHGHGVRVRKPMHPVGLVFYRNSC
jgi:uncharacterized protein DUF6345